jgi:hypothetical protein
VAGLLPDFISDTYKLRILFHESDRIDDGDPISSRYMAIGNTLDYLT